MRIGMAVDHGRFGLKAELTAALKTSGSRDCRASIVNQASGNLNLRENDSFHTETGNFLKWQIVFSVFTPG